MEKENYQSAFGPHGDIGSWYCANNEATSKSSDMRYTIIQSFWTKPLLKHQEKLKDTLYIAALSLAFAHRSGYRVHMHTDSKGAELLKGFGYESLLTTLDSIPNTVPAELFAAGKFYAMRAEGIGKVHIDYDVFLKKPGVIDRFYEKSETVDAICQCEEDMTLVNHQDKTEHMYVMGYPAGTRPDWKGSMNTGIVGFNNSVLADRYIGNYFEALEMYNEEKFAKYKRENPRACLTFDFILEQITLSCMSIGYNMYVLLPTKEPTPVADKIGYQHLQGSFKWTNFAKKKVRQLLYEIDRKLYDVVHKIPR